MANKSGIRRFLSAAKGVVTQFPKAIKMSFEGTYYADKKRKRYITRLFDNLKWIFKYHEANKFYTLYGLDVCGADMKAYLDYRTFMDERNYLNRVDEKDSQIALLRDKFVFYRYMKEAGINVPKIIALWTNGELFDTLLKPLNYEEFLKDKENYFVKDLSGECASFVKKCKSYDDFKSLIPQFAKDAIYLIQEEVFQHSEMNKLNPCAINTLRIVTARKGSRAELFSAEIRIGTKQSGHVDNLAAGGICVGIDSTGKLSKYGLCKLGNYKLLEEHPDTHIKFSDFTIPEYEKCVSLVCEAHSQFYNVKFIGWDVAVTENGPTIIEGNDNWEISGLQAANGGLRNAWEQAKNDFVKQ